MPEYAIETTDLRIDYGDFTAVESLSLRIPTGSIYGLVGPNGAGKTSTIRALAGLLDPTFGEIRLGGVDLREEPHAAFRLIGYMPDLAPVIPDLTVREFLFFFAGMYALPEDERRPRVEEVLAHVRMTEAADKLASTLSRGMTQRVVLAKTLLHRPSVLLLDEPASGMDPIARLDLRATLEDLRKGGCTILVSSHILSELAEMCTDLAVLHRGELRMSGSVRSILNRAHSAERLLRLEPLGDPAPLAAFLESGGHLNYIKSGEGEIEGTFAGTDEALADLLAAIVQAGHRLRAFEPKRSGLEELLRELDGEATPK
ncbi:MAG: ABC transporter ATP-binding protein [Opitutales bacterium]|nr:ABC transporter ATP-binding protein [Opitutales bacterium]